MNNRKLISIRDCYIYKHLAYSEPVFAPNMVNCPPTYYCSKRMPDRLSELVTTKAIPKGLWNIKESTSLRSPFYLEEKKFCLYLIGLVLPNKSC